MDKYAFDLEMWQNFFSAVFINVNDTDGRHIFLIYKNRNDLKDLVNFVNREITLVGYNNLWFDNVILNYLINGNGKNTNNEIYDFAQNIIEGEQTDHIKQFRWQKTRYKSIDLKELLGLDIGLKQATVAAEWHTVLDLPFSPDYQVQDQDIKLILEYNQNDVLPLIDMYWNLQDQFSLREGVKQVYGVDVLTLSEGRIGNVIFEELYSKAINTPKWQIKKSRTPRKSLQLKECVGTDIIFQSPQLQQLFKQWKKADLISGFSDSFRFSSLNFNIGEGGLHTIDPSGVFVSNNDYIIIDTDVASFYPAIMLKNSIKPEHLGNTFFDIYKRMVQERLEAKANGEKLKANVLKITINAVFGKMGNPDLWFYDPKAFYSVTISGQLYLLSLIDRLSQFEILSANTDGVVTKVPRKQAHIYYNVAREWCKYTGFKLEFDTYSRYVRRDGNNYVAKSIERKIKRKGIFEIREDVPFYKRLQKGYGANIIPLALSEYFINDTPIEDFVQNHPNIFDFLMSERTDKKFTTILRNGKNDNPQQKTNRYYISNEGGVLLKKEGNREISICSKPVQILNLVESTQAKNYNINYAYYISEINKIINAIYPPVSNLAVF